MSARDVTTGIQRQALDGRSRLEFSFWRAGPQLVLYGGRQWRPVFWTRDFSQSLRLTLQERQRVGRPLEDVVDLVGRLEADDEGVDGAQPEDITQ